MTMMMPSARTGRRLRRRRRPKNDRHIPKDLYLAFHAQMRREGHRMKLERLVVLNWDKQVVLDLAEDAISRERVEPLCKGKVLIGHSLDYILRALNFTHPWIDLRDIATYAPFMKEVSDPLSVMLVPRPVEELQTLTKKYSEDPLIQQASSCMKLYQSTRTDWEQDMAKILQQRSHPREMMNRTMVDETYAMASVAAQDIDLNEILAEFSNALIEEGEGKEDDSAVGPRVLPDDDLTSLPSTNYGDGTNNSRSSSIWLPSTTDTLSGTASEAASTLTGPWFPSKSRHDSWAGSTTPTEAFTDYDVDENLLPAKLLAESSP